MTGISLLLQVGLVFSVLGQVAPHLLHAYRFLPFLFLLMACTVLLLWTLVWMIVFADRTMRTFTANTRAEKRESRATTVVEVPLHLEAFWRVNITMSSICAVAILCMVAWLVDRVGRSWSLYVLPLLDSFDEIEIQLWDTMEDMRGRVPPEALSKE